MQLQIKTQGVDFVVSREPQPKNDNDGRQKTDRETGELLHVTELVAMDDAGAEVIKVTTAGEPEVCKRQLVTVVNLVATPWEHRRARRCGLSGRLDRLRPHRRARCGPGKGRRAASGA
jgi:hypothetical protein